VHTFTLLLNLKKEFDPMDNEQARLERIGSTMHRNNNKEDEANTKQRYVVFKYFEFKVNKKQPKRPIP
jgi:hypothetical protein